MNIKATYDQTITKAIRDDDGNVIGHEPKHTILHLVVLAVK